jgi:hypothetical protein
MSTLITQGSYPRPFEKPMMTAEVFLCLYKNAKSASIYVDECWRFFCIYEEGKKASSESEVICHVMAFIY